MPLFTTEAYLRVLFDSEDHICIATSVYCNHTRSVKEIIEGPDKNYEFVCVNAFKEGTTRARRNVNVFRNFMIEFDDIPIDKQRLIVQDTGMPYSIQVFSGGKSVHFVISLEEPLKSREVWDHLSRWLYSIFSDHDVDTSCKNPDRFTRVGGGYRTNRDMVQQILINKGRVPNVQFLEWLQGYPEPSNRVHHVSTDTSLFGEAYDEDFRGKPSKETIKFARTGGAKGKRHGTLFKAACDLRDQRYTLKEAMIVLLTKISTRYKIEGRLHDLAKHERTIIDAYKNYPMNPPRH